MFIVDTFDGVSSPTAAATEEVAVDTAFDRQLPSWTMPRLAIDSYLLAAATEEAAVDTALDGQPLGLDKKQSGGSGHCLDAVSWQMQMMPHQSTS